MMLKIPAALSIRFWSPVIASDRKLQRTLTNKRVPVLNDPVFDGALLFPLFEVFLGLELAGHLVVSRVTEGTGDGTGEGLFTSGFDGCLVDVREECCCARSEGEEGL